MRARNGLILNILRRALCGTQARQIFTVIHVEFLFFLHYFDLYVFIYRISQIGFTNKVKTRKVKSALCFSTIMVTIVKVIIKITIKN